MGEGTRNWITKFLPILCVSVIVDLGGFHVFLLKNKGKNFPLGVAWLYANTKDSGLKKNKNNNMGLVR